MKAKHFFLLFLLAALWGPSFLFIKIAVQEIHPLALASLRIGVAAILLNIYVILIKKRIVKDRRFWFHVGISGFFGQGLPFLLINWGEQYVGSALAAILNGLTPIFTIVIANFFIADERMSLAKFAGTFLGFLGLVVLISPGFQEGLTTSTLGVLAISIAAISYGIALVYNRIHLKNAPPLTAPASQLLVGSVYMIPLGWYFGIPGWQSVSIQAYASVFILASLGTALAFVIYFSLLEKTSAGFVSQVTYMMPVIGVALGLIFLGESLQLETIVGGVIILVGIMVANGAIRFRKSFFKISKTTV